MSKEVSAFTPLQDVESIWVAHKSTLRCVAVKLVDDSLCLYSPVAGLGDTALNSLKAIGDVKYLLAPNHYHYKGLQQYKEAYPRARLVCSDAARPRLEKQTGLKFGVLDTLLAALPPAVKLLHPAGLKTGEVWLDYKLTDQRALVVTDAFKGVGKSMQSISSDVELLGSFPSFGIKDRNIYAEWIENLFGKVHEYLILIPCHGPIAAGPDTAKQSVDLVSNLRK